MRCRRTTLAAVALLVAGGCIPNGPQTSLVLGNATPSATLSGSKELGRVWVLSTGNVVAVDSQWAGTGETARGAVFVFNGETRALISKIYGTTDNDEIGSNGILELRNGNFVVLSPQWHNGATADAGAATWVNGTTGAPVGSGAQDADGVWTYAVSAANSFIGNSNGAEVGRVGGALEHTDNYIVGSSFSTKGAVTWGNGTTGLVGVMSSANSLVGATAGDTIGDWTELPNGNLVISSSWFDNGAAVNAGMVSLMSGTGPTSGVVSAANSLVGSSTEDRVGGVEIAVLTNGNWVLRAPSFGDNDRGAVVWGSATTPISGTISTANAFVGATADDRIGDSIAALRNGNYAFTSPDADINGLVDAGAVTWGNGATGSSGTVGPANSIVGAVAGDQLGSNGVVAAGPSAYVFASPHWNADTGAATWVSGTGPSTGNPSTADSLVGATSGDKVGSNGVVALTNGNYVVISPNWKSDRGAVTWGKGTTGTRTTVVASNSITGATPGALVGSGGVEPLTNGNYVVSSIGASTFAKGSSATRKAVGATNSLLGYQNPSTISLRNGNYLVVDVNWDNPLTGATGAGGVTWAKGTKGVVGTVSSANSLVGSRAGDHIGLWVEELTNGNVVTASQLWSNATSANVGAVTWINGTKGRVGVVGPSNSLVGSHAEDHLGSGGVFPLEGGDYAVVSPLWDSIGGSDPQYTNAGAVSFGDGLAGGTVGEIDGLNSAVGIDNDAGAGMNVAGRLSLRYMVAGAPAMNGLMFFSLIPGSPTRPLAARSGSSAKARWGRPDASSVLPITYTVTATPGGRSCSTTLLYCTVRGLNPSTPYTFTVTASTRIGGGPANTAEVGLGPTLKANQKMYAGSYLLSPDARTALVLTASGDLQLLVDNLSTEISGTADMSVAYAIVTAAGNLELRAANDSVVWSAPIASPVAGSAVSVVSGVAIMAKNNVPTWSFGTAYAATAVKAGSLRSGATLPETKYLRSSNKQCALGLLNGALVVWAAGVTTFNSDTFGSGATKIVMTPGGDVQLLDNGNVLKYSLGTSVPGSKLSVDDACRLVVSKGKTVVTTRG